MENYSLADIKAVAGDGMGMGNCGSLILIVLFLLFGNAGWGNRGEFGNYATAASQQEILFGQQFQGLDNKIDRIGNGIADATFALNNSVTTEGRNIQAAIANCCCENLRNTDSLRYDMVTQNQKILDALAQNKIESLQAQVNNLQMQIAMAGVVRYPTASTYYAGNNPYCNGNNGCGCGV